ncbi:Coenzyme F420 hydrogenase/dehydrogenase, beta subunit C-terminal domain [Halanaerobium sp. Z-7514]|uniref:Coenzyme F420 hydrogenase/dehydrogenase, beta subunit C-terminal domain n=1 Tax=Halanaerobium polyolivorans TaxID=2886943 RepID=A0AAW4X1G0_9FIRM|nr:Coenzyme F420 hydrogenase/dehydrogenase, beta subunit C-terminal domain [Halanaerobium polyolivorans]MCC3145637.1 Coenzyme F420 hydrogenase/dehydrogenase, beta subunit C-terminal domain [Halanaerobium polyolivorans]RQD73229.1 MAG: 4Fe-4S dicluster domain-containing protein [Halanaerobium sp. MSAO_Bac5]
MKHVGKLKLNYICTGCGSCEVICPVNAIKLGLDFDFYTPKVDNELCVSCNKCLNICPGLEINNKKLSQKFLAINVQHKSDYILGNYISNYIGYSNNSSLRFNAASGGIASHLLLFLLKNNYIDAAIVTKMDEKNPLMTKSIIAHSREEIINAKTSKYCPTSPITALKKVKAQKKNNKKYAFVGLPCQIQGLRKLQENDEWFKNNIIFTIGLLCSHSVKYSGTRVILDRLDFRKNKVRQIQYRGQGWPGQLNIEAEKTKTSIPLDEYWESYFASYFFTPYRCITCHDLMAELADISLGDAWLNEIIEKDDKGSSIMISRTEFAEKIIKEMKNKNSITAYKINTEKIKESQKEIIMRRKGAFKYRIELLDFFNKPRPKYEDHSLEEIKNDSTKIKLKSYFGSFLIYLSAFLGSTLLGELLIKKTSTRLLKKWSFFIYKFGGRKYHSD